MLRRTRECDCGCGRVLKGQAQGFAKLGGQVSHLLDGLSKVIEPFIPADAPERTKLAQIQTDGRALEADLFGVAHRTQELPRYSIQDFEQWMGAATELIGARARDLSAKGIDPAALTGWRP